MGSALTLLGVRSTADWIYSYALSSAFRSQYVYDPSFALMKDPDIWEVVRNDVATTSAITRSTNSIVRPWRMEPFHGSKDPEDKRLAAVCTDALVHIRRFNARRRRLSEARFLARTYGAVLWKLQRVKLGDLEEMDWYIPYHIQDVDRRRIHWVTDWDKGMQQKIGIHREMYNTNTQRWEVLPPELQGSMIEYIVGDNEDRIGNGRGLLEPIYFYHYLKIGTFEKIADGIDRWANGVWIAKLDGLRGASTAKTNENLRQAAETVLLTMRSQHAAVVEKVDDIEVKETTGTGHQISMDFVRYLDEAIERLCNGSVRPAGHSLGGTGSRAQAETEEDTSEAFFQNDREDLDDVTTTDLVHGFLRNNRPTLEKAGLAKARPPRFTSEQVKKQDPKTAVEVMNAALTKVPLSRRQYYEKIECEDPGDQEEAIGPFPEAVPGSPGGPDFRDFGIKGGEDDSGKPKKSFSFPSGDKSNTEEKSKEK